MLRVEIGERRQKNSGINIDVLLRVYPLLVDLVRAKRSTVVKPRDLRRIFGIKKHGLLTQLGKLLSLLAALGYAIRLNSQRPIRYKLVPKDMWQWIAKNCDLKCVSDGTACRLLGICPYHKLLEVKNRE